MWSIDESDDFKKGCRRLEPVASRLRERLRGMLHILERDPFLYPVTTPLFPDEPDRRIIRSGSFMEGFEVTACYLVDDSTRTVRLEWIERIYCPESGPEE